MPCICNIWAIFPDDLSPSPTLRYNPEIHKYLAVLGLTLPKQVIGRSHFVTSGNFQPI